MGQSDPIEATSPVRGHDDGDEFTLLSYWRIIVGRRWVIAFCVGAFLAVGAMLTLLTPPRYTASAVLQVDRSGPEILNFRDILGGDPMAYRNFAVTQTRIIESRSVLARAAERIDLANRPEFLNRRGSPIGRLQAWVRSLFSSSQSDDPDYEAMATGYVAGGLRVEAIRNSSLIVVSFEDNSPTLAAEIANAIAEAFQTYQLETRYTANDQASEFLTKEVARLQAEIAERERQLQEYGSEKAILSLSDGAQDISEQALAEMNMRLAAARGRMAVAQAHLQEVQEARPSALPEVMSSPLIHTLKEQHAALESRYAQMRERFKPGWPALAQLAQEVEQSRLRLEREQETIALQVVDVARTGYDQARGEVENLRQQVELQKREVQRVNRDTIQYASIRAEIDSRRKVLEGLITRKSETETSGQLKDVRASNVRIIDRAEAPPAPSSPRMMVNLNLSLLLGLGFGLGLAFVLHYVDNTIKSESDLQRYGSGITVLGHIPRFESLRVVRDEGVTDEGPRESDSDLASHRDQNSTFAEAFKNLRTSLLLASPGHAPKTILVTSCQPGDGKSTAAMNLAITLSQLNRRVLLIDADLRRPRLHRALNISNEAGLSSYLTGQADAASLIQATSVDRFSIISSGPIPPNPSELLDSPRLDELFSGEWMQHFDHILIDSPPTIQVSDSMILAPRFEATLLIVRAGVTTRDALAAGVSRLVHARAKLVGAVLNDVHQHSNHYYRYGYTYGYAERAESADDTPSRYSLASISKRLRKGRERRAG